MNAAPGSTLPGSYRWALVAAVVVGFQVALSAGFDVQAALDHDAPAAMVGSEAAVPGSGLSPLSQRQVWLASISGYKSALSGMLPWRVTTSVLLALASGVVFLLAMRLRLTQEARAPIAEHLGRAALVAAVLRSIDGAENLVLARTTADEMGKALIREGMANAEETASLVTGSVSLATAGWTFVMVAGFVALGSYFRSETLRAALLRAEP